MLTIKLSGGLGNQMFQYALIRGLSEKYNTEMRLDLSFLQKMGHGYIKKVYDDFEFVNFELYPFNVQKKIIQKKNLPFYENFYTKNKYLNFFLLKSLRYFKNLFPSFHGEKRFNFDSKFLSVRSGYIEGYFQSEKYFKSYEKIIRKDFEFKLSPSKENLNIIEIINSTYSVALHVRRGDYVSNPANSMYNTCGLNYYNKAIKLIQEKVEKPVFFLFSDDMNWVRENININGDFHYIDWNDNQHNYEDMRLMSLCKHNIIANSSFSWWGAWLNNNPTKIVIAPGIWFNESKIDYSDIVPESWIKI